ncbi:MAG: YkgJ family cysteine cluster protein [Candidatus Lokiarchaeota archaeon]|nr:YkgJ family cysteine cluster protein [Candidatus Lokiarchaeota archaeon]
MSEDKKNEIKENKKEETSEEPKKKFTFKCTRCDNCCLKRGPIPITQWDLEIWAKNGVLSNFLPYLDIYNNPNGTMDLILKPFNPKDKENKGLDNIFNQSSIEDLLEEKCPLYNKEEKKCLVYENRPLSCQTYPLEYNGQNYVIVDNDCPGIGKEGMTKEELKIMRETAQKINYELTRTRISLPIFSQILSQKVMMDLMRQNMEAMNKMSDEDRAKVDDIFKKSGPKNEPKNEN